MNEIFSQLDNLYRSSIEKKKFYFNKISFFYKIFIFKLIQPINNHDMVVIILH